VRHAVVTGLLIIAWIACVAWTCIGITDIVYKLTHVEPCDCAAEPCR
jgi:hypothetical protein